VKDTRKKIGLKEKLKLMLKDYQTCNVDSKHGRDNFKAGY
jgi:hypothetical protein